MKIIFATVFIGLFSAAASAKPCMDANVSPLGYYDSRTADEIHLDEEGC